MFAKARSVRLAPKKANIIAKLVRGRTVRDALDLLENTDKKSARIFEKLLRSAMANAEHNYKQSAQQMVIKSVIVNKGMGYARGVPMARGRVRPIVKFLSHIELEIGAGETEKSQQSKTSKKSEVKSDEKLQTPNSKLQTSTKKPAAKKEAPKKSSSSTK